MSNNGDETLEFDLEFAGPGSSQIVGVGNFHKTLPHNDFGEVDPVAYAQFKDVAALGGDYDVVPRGPVGTAYVVPAPAHGDGFNDPQASRSHDKLTGGAHAYEMPPAPRVLSRSTAAEFTELQWMAILRDKPFSEFAGDPQVGDALTDLQSEFNAALGSNEPGGLQLGVDLPRDAGGNLDMRLQTLFRCGLRGEDKGPQISQFFLHDIAYGAQFITQKVRPYVHARNFLTDHESWLRAQNAGLDEWAHGYSGDNDFSSDSTLEEPGGERRITTMRDLCRFVNKDALHQAYFNAALLCLNWNIPLNSGNPYRTYNRQAPFGTFGGPDILTRVSEVAGRALSVVWRQKWGIHRRLRPEAYGGLMQMQEVGLPIGGLTTKRPYGLPSGVFNTAASQYLKTHMAMNYYLPMAFTAGSPPHPSYGAGHATVAGACVTVLKAWFAGSTRLRAHLTAHPPKSPFKNAPGSESPVVISIAGADGALTAYGGADVDNITVEGELNKIACNVAMGRSMGGVHWRTDNTRSLRLGEQIATELLRSESEDYTEHRKPDGRPPYWEFISFNGKVVIVSAGKVYVNGQIQDPKSAPL